MTDLNINILHMALVPGHLRDRRQVGGCQKQGRGEETIKRLS